MSFLAIVWDSAESLQNAILVVFTQTFDAIFGLEWLVQDSNALAAIAILIVLLFLA